MSVLSAHADPVLVYVSCCARPGGPSTRELVTRSRGSESFAIDCFSLCELTPLKEIDLVNATQIAMIAFRLGRHVRWGRIVLGLFLKVNETLTCDSWRLTAIPLPFRKSANKSLDIVSVLHYLSVRRTPMEVYDDVQLCEGSTDDLRASIQRRQRQESGCWPFVHLLHAHLHDSRNSDGQRGCAVRLSGSHCRFPVRHDSGAANVPSH